MCKLVYETEAWNSLDNDVLCASSFQAFKRLTLDFLSLVFASYAMDMVHFLKPNPSFKNSIGPQHDVT